jgi:hypothetical protein
MAEGSSGRGRGRRLELASIPITVWALLWSPEWAAFSYVAGAPKHSDERPRLEWRSGSCGSPVTDLGPDVGPNPSDREQGRTYDCDRHSAEVRAFMDQFGGN